MNSDSYLSLEKPTTEQLFKLKNSKFYSYGFKIRNQDEVKTHLAAIKKQHHKARHWCYAWQLGNALPYTSRANDDGEPSNTAGAPILGQIRSFELTNVLVVVVRYFGGVKLGVGGLITAYRSAAKQCLENATIASIRVTDTLKLSYDYKCTSEVMRLVKKHQLDMDSQAFSDSCELLVNVPKSQSDVLKKQFEGIYGVKVSII